MPLDPAVYILLTLGIAGAVFALGRFLARRIPPWRRRPWGVMTALILVIGLVVANNSLSFLPREQLRLLLMFSATGWIIGVVGCRD
ncbi:MAG: hypothetical protein GX755_03815 [Syntrophomonadaceae bacterium]|jgi:hypothetical protein|nr:hypothetical protein [Syntrophomonadaceae bacterium]